MIKVLKNGNDKVYVLTCFECKSTLLYKKEDVVTERGSFRGHVKCPVCGCAACNAPTYIEYKEEG